MKPMAAPKIFFSIAAPFWLIILLGLSAARVTAHDCYASVGGARGHVYQFDGGSLAADPAGGGCLGRQLVLTRSSGECKFDILASFKAVGHRKLGLSKLSSLSVKVDGKEYSLLIGRRLTVNGHSKSIPYGVDHGIRVFYSGEDVVLVHKRCNFWLAFDGKWTATYRLGAEYRGKVAGLAGNCDGQRHDDPDDWLSNAGCHSDHSGSSCQSPEAKQEAVNACQRVIKDPHRDGHGCNDGEVLQPCIDDACAAHKVDGLRRKILCANFYLQSRRCAKHHRPLAWRKNSGCPLKCGPNQSFSSNASPCPDTCGSHFFGVPKRCFHLPSAEGCRCDSGFVLDEANHCVRPKQCKCLKKLCLDRMPRSKCLRWRAHGRCKRYPEAMAKFCRLTCGHCRPKCGQNQFRDELCLKLKRKGKCAKKFYRAVCSAACGVNKCRCPANRRVVSKCSSRYKNRSVTSIRWLPGPHGRCVKSTLRHYEPCGSCPDKAKTVFHYCNYCTGIRSGKRTEQRRERHGLHRCLQRVVSVSRKCHCPPPGYEKAVSYKKCERHSVLIKVTKVFQPAKHCSKCVRITRRTVIKKIHCSGQSTVLGKCHPGSKYRKRKVFVRYASHCKCRLRLEKVQKLRCSCSKKRRSKRLCSISGEYQITITSGLRLKDLKCVRWERKDKQKVKCSRNHRARIVCNKNTCSAVKVSTYHKLEECKCVKKIAKRHIGKCCCPSGYKKTVRLDRYWKKLIRVQYRLEKHQCHRKVFTRKFRVACPKASRSVRCDHVTGSKISTKVWYILKGDDCIKRRTRKVARLHCKHGVLRHVGPCSHIGRRGISRFRKVRFEFYRKKPGSCSCVRVRRTVKELCGCRRGSFVKTTECPKTGCSGGKHCGPECHYTKTYFYFAKRKGEGRHKDQHCHAKVFKRQQFRCCCPGKRRVKRWCRSQKYSMRRVTYTQLSKDQRECQRLSRISKVRVRCPHNLQGKSVTKRLPHPKSGYYYLATYHWHVRNCRCSKTVVRRKCRKHCQPSKKSRHCNVHTGEWVTRHVSWKLHGCRTCIQRVRESRSPVHCRRAEHQRHCDGKSGVLTTTVTRWKRKGCKCVQRKRVKHLRCKCPKPVVGKRQCDSERNAYIQRTTFWLLKSGKCIKRHRIKVTRVHCSHSVRRKYVCRAKSGVKSIYIGVLKPKGCHCARVWSLHNRLRCNCDHENHAAKHHRRQFCDHSSNRKATVTYRYVLKKGHCVRKSKTRYRSYTCPAPYTQKHACDERRRIQITVTHYSVKRNCSCVRAVKKKSRKCGCPHTEPSRKRYCRKDEGLVVSELTTQRWSHKKERCIKRTTKKSHRVSCSQKTHYSVTKCIGNKFYVETKVYHIRKGCKCLKRSIKKKRNCHCKSITRRYKCPKRGYTRRIVTKIRRWDSAKKQCRTVRHVTRRLRCRCPAGSRRHFCHAGAWVTETLTFALRHGRCYKRVKRQLRRVACRSDIKHRYTPCYKTGCRKRYIYTMKQKLDKKRCSCYYAVVKRRACPCCCSKTVRHKKRCVKSGTAWQQATVGYRVLRGKKCGCKKWLRRVTDRVECTKHRQLIWLACDRKKSCLSRQREISYIVRGCRCQKVSKFTGKQRVCCCPDKTKRRRFCRHSAIYAKTSRLHLKQWRCVRVTHLRLVRHWRCHAKPKTVIGKCDRSTCRQPLHTLVTRIDQPHCRCHRVVVKRHHRTCCCLQRPKRTKHCDSATAAWVSTKIAYVFNASRHVCVRKRRTVRSPVHCQSKRKDVGSCNKRTCRRVVKHISFYVHQCRCHRQVRRSSHICCCPPAKYLPVYCDKSKHEWVRRKISWHLTHGQCVKRISYNRRRITCSQKVTTRVHTCNRHTCKRQITHKVRRIKGCQCVVHRRITHRTCCCRPEVRSKTRCEHDCDLVKYSKLRILDHHSYTCKTRVVKKLLHRLRKCHSTVNRSACNLKTRHRTIRKVLRRPKHCRCQVYRRIAHRLLCSCPNAHIKRTKCNKASCHKSVIKTWYTSHGHDATFKCRKHRRTTRIRCCCKRNPSSRVFCDRHSGAIKRETGWTVFVASRKACVRRKKVELVKRLVCRKSNCRISKCDKHSGYRIKVCVSHEPVRHKCNCSSRAVRRKIICHCPKSHSRKFCKGDSHKIHIRTSWRISLHENRCIKQVKRVVSPVVCSKRHWRVTKCHGRPDCHGKVFYHRYKIHKCRCQRITRAHSIACCCPKPTKVKRCHGNKWITVLTRHKLTKGRCLKKVKKIRVTVGCRHTRVRIGDCDKDCKKRRVILRYQVKDCKCTLVKRLTRTKKCCCPRPKSRKVCKAARGLIQKIRVFWRLTDGKCLKQRRTVSHKVVCQGGWSRLYKCDPNTRHQKAVIVRYRRVACRCRRERRIRRLLCRCRPPRIIKEKCTKKKEKRHIYKITYRLSHPHKKLAQRHCLKQKRLWYTEPCRCPKPITKRSCTHKGAVIETKTQTWHLTAVKRLYQKAWIHLHECQRKTTVKHRSIHCKARTVSWSKCHNCQRRRTTVKHWPHNCKCRRSASVRVFACNCEKKSTMNRRCDAKSGDLVYTRKSCFSRHDAPTCSCTTRSWRRHIRCERRYRRHRLTKRHCGLKLRHAWYNRYSVKWTIRRGCGCVRKRSTVRKFCHCQRGHKRSYCAIDGKTWVKIVVSYRPNHKHQHGCHKVKKVTKLPVACLRDGGKAKVRFGGCNKHCKRSVSVRQCYIRHCQEKLYVKSALQLCCKPKPKRRHYCQKKTGQWVTETVHYRLKTSVPLLKDRHGKVLAHQKKLVAKTRKRHRQVNCPRSNTREVCHRRSGRWEKTRVTWYRVGCHCKRRVKLFRGRCKCPPKRVHWGPCVHRHKVRTVIKFSLSNHKCHRKVSRRLFLCACPKARRYTLCDGCGAWKTCHVTYHLRFRQQRCIKKRRCRSRLHTCPAAVESRSKCVDCLRVIRRVSWRLNKKKCACRRVTRRRTAECDCWKKNSKKTVCQHGAFVTRIVTYRQRGEKCVKVQRTISRPVHCRHRRTKSIVHGSCVTKAGHRHSGYQKLLLQSYYRKGCKCYRKRAFKWVPCVCHLIKRFKTRRSVHCRRGREIVHKKIYYVLRSKGHKCVKRVHNRSRKVVCSGVKNKRSPCKLNHKGDKYSVTHVLRRQSNGHCGCTWRLASKHKHVCHCRPSHRTKQCVHDKTRRQILTSYQPVHGKGYCRGKQHIRDEHLSCPGKFSKKSKCHKCSFTVQQYAYRLAKCGCVAHKVATKNLRCCCPGPITKHSCDAKRHLIVAVTSSYELRDHRCHRRRVTRSRRVHCGRKKPQYRVSKCGKDGFRQIRKTRHFAVACHCQKRTIVRKQRCSCPHTLIHKPGKCGRRFAHDIWLGYHLKNTGVKIPGTNKLVKKCIKVVVERRKRRCRCPKPYHRTVCRRDDLILKISVSYRLHKNSCQRSRVVQKRHLSCHKHPQLVQRIVSPKKCTAKTDYVQSVKRVYLKAKNCRCRKSQRVTHRICDCFRKYGGKKHIVKCVEPNRLVKRTFWMAKSGHSCVKKFKTTVKAVRCPKKLRIRAGQCKHSSGLKSFKFYHLVARHCRCVWQLSHRTKAPCRCPKSKHSTRCHNNGSWIKTILKWRLVSPGPKAKCVLHRQQKVHPVPCKVGRQVKRHNCDHEGYRLTVIHTKKLSKCKCLKNTERRRCRCRCPKDSEKRVCHGGKTGRIWLTIRVSYKLSKCACGVTRSVNKLPVTCPKKTREVGHCKRGKKGDFYKKEVCTSWRVAKCKCHRSRRIQRHLCGCDARPVKKLSCLAGFVRVSIVTERRLLNGHCRRVVVKRHRERVHCGRVQKQRICDKRSGRLSIIVVKPYVKSCRCYKRVVRHTRRCGCHARRKLSVGKCDRHSCRQRLVFKRQVLDKKSSECVWQSSHKHRTCCCHGLKRSKECRHKEGQIVVTVVKQVLRNWKCVKQVSQASRAIKCKRNETHRSTRLKGGILKLDKCWTVRKGCRCVKRCRTHFKRYRCQRPTKRRHCSCSDDDECNNEILLTHWRLVDGYCFRQTRVHSLPIVCPYESVSRSRCDHPTKYGFYYVKKTISWRRDACRCVRVTRRSCITCRCWRPRAYSRCHHKRGLVEYIRTSYKLRHGRCLKSVKRRFRRVLCGHHKAWRYSHKAFNSSQKGLYFKVYVRAVRVGCLCKREFKKVPCRSSCQPCVKKRRCSSTGKEIVISRTCWHLSHCRCIRRTSVRRHHVRCPHSKQRKRCHRGGSCAVTVVIKRFHARACRCVSSTKVHQTGRRCCCPAPRRSRSCIHGSIRVRTVSYRLHDGRCHASVSDAHRPVHCPQKLRYAIHGRCKQGRQQYAVHYWAKQGCRCVRRVRLHNRHCSCKYKVVELVVAVDLHSPKGGDAHSGYRSHVARFLETVLRHFKYGSSKVRTTLFAYSSSVHKHHIKSHGKHKSISFVDFTNGKTNLHGALKAINAQLHRSSQRHPKGVKRIVLIVTRGKHTESQSSVTLAEKIRRKARVFVIGFGSLPKDGRYVKWLASKPRRLHYLTMGGKRDYHFPASRIFERACQKHCKRNPKKQVGACKRDTCRRLITHTEWRRDKHTGKCQRTRSTKSRVCCCLGKNSERVICSHGRRIRIKTSYNFDAHKSVCRRVIHRIDISASLYAHCRSASIRHRGKCDADDWRRDVLETRYVDQNTCICRTKRRHLRPIRCRCPPSRSQRACRRDEHGRWYKVRCRIGYKLHPYGCTKRRQCSKRRVVCRHNRKFVRGHCHRHSCQRRQSLITYSVHGCRCRRKIKTWSEICCCKRPSRNYSFCDKHRHLRVRVHIKHKLLHGACRPISRRSEQAVQCRSGSRILKGHCQRHGTGYYRHYYKQSWHVRNCHCVRQTQKSGLRLCGCIKRKRRSTQCSASHGVLVTKEFWLHPQNNHCRWRKRIVGRERITCSRRRTRSWGRCGHGRAAKAAKEAAGDGRKFAVVTVTWQYRDGCKCRQTSRSHVSLCACPKRARRVTRCHANRLLSVKIYRYRLVHRSRHGDSRHCRLVSKENRLRILCRKPLVRLGRKCHSGKRSVSVTVYLPRRCRCKSKVYNQLVDCKAACIDKLPSKVCKKWASLQHIKICKRHPHLAEQLCAATCGHCCSKPTIVYSGEHCLTSQLKSRLPARIGGKTDLILAKKSTFEACSRSCEASPLCRAFDYHPASSNCKLLRQNHHSLHRGTLGLRFTPGCLLFEKTCKARKLVCPYRRILKISRCHCRPVFGKHQHPFCYRHAFVAVYYHHYGRCRRRTQRVLVPCRKCEDTKHWCTEVAHRGKCSKSAKVRQLCRHSCRQCRRHKINADLIHLRIGRCSKEGWQKITRGGIYYDHWMHLWRVRLSESQKRCVNCPVGSKLIVGRCSKHGKRKLTWLVVSRHSDKDHCRVHRRASIVDCSGCGGLDRTRKVGRCVHVPGKGWQRSVTTSYTEKKSRKGKCVVQTHTESFKCSPKCPKRKETRSSCKCGRRMVCTEYYVTYPVSSNSKHGGYRCVAKKVTKSEKCVSAAKGCHDRLKLNDCQAIKKSKMCSTLHSLCSKTCGRCK